MTTPQEDSEQSFQTTQTYVPSGYQETSWEVIESDTSLSDDFQVTEFETIGGGPHEVDPMFPDFSSGGFVADSFGAPGVSEQDTENVGEHFTPEDITSQEDAGTFQAATPEAESTKEDEAAKEPPSDSPIPDEQVSDSLETSPTDASGSIEEDESAESGSKNPEASSHEETTGDAGDVSSTEGVDSLREEEQDEFQEESINPVDPVQAAFDEGFAQATQEAQEQKTVVSAQIEEQYTLLWEDMQVQLDEMKVAHETQAVELAMRVAHKLVGQVVGEHREYIIEIIREALNSAGKSQINAIRVSPQSYELLSLDEYGDRVKIHGEQKLTFTPDESIRAGCIVETSSGELDFDLDRAWNSMYSKVSGTQRHE